MANDKKVCITGGAGFISRALIKKLLARGYQVKVFDIKQPQIDSVEFVQGNVMDPDAVKKAFQGCGFVFHLASPVGVRETEAAGTSTFTTIMESMKNVLESCKINQVRKIFFSSSSEVYGEPSRSGAKVDDQLRPKSEYGKGKMMAEGLVREFRKVYPLDHMIARFFSVYGPYQRTEFVVPKFVSAACKNEPLYLYGDGQQVRAFCYVDDVTEATLNAFEKTNNETFNIGNDQEPITMKALAEKVKELAKSKSKIEYLPLEKTDRSASREIYHRIPDLSKTKNLTGFQAKTPLSEGLLKTIEYFRSNP